MCNSPSDLDNSLRERYPTVSANKIINFLIEGGTDTSDAVFTEFLICHPDEVNIEGEAELPKPVSVDKPSDKLLMEHQPTQPTDTPLDNSRVITRQNMRSKNVPAQ